jgi:hypothetical protein
VRRLAAALALFGAACAPIDAPLPNAPVPSGPAIVVDAQPVPLDPTDPARTRLGNFTYAGGVVLTSRQTSRLHGLSDLKAWPDGRLLILSDQSDLLEARVRLDPKGHLVGLSDARLTALKDENGVDLYAGGQKEYDSEGIAELANGDRIVSFEQHDRIFVFPRGGGLPRPAPMPDYKFVFNHGMEALAADPAAGPDAYRVGDEATGRIFRCRLSAACVQTGQVDVEGLELVAFEALPGRRMAYLLRGYSPVTQNTVRLRIIDADGRRVDGMELVRPLTVDNLEGLGAVPGPGGGIRFYLTSDDNFGAYNGHPTEQRTLLLAFDWRLPADAPPQGELRRSR